MKKAILVGMLAAAITGCSSMKEVSERKAYAQPDWYQECQQAGVKGYFWWKKEFAYACGGFAKRINSEVNSETRIDFVNDKKSTKTSISYVVKNTTIREHMKTETAQFTMQGRHYTFVRLEMPKEVFDTLIAEAKQAKAQ